MEDTTCMKAELCSSFLQDQYISVALCQQPVFLPVLQFSSTRKACLQSQTTVKWAKGMDFKASRCFGLRFGSNHEDLFRPWRSSLSMEKSTSTWQPARLDRSWRMKNPTGLSRRCRYQHHGAALIDTPAWHRSLQWTDFDSHYSPGLNQHTELKAKAIHTMIK